MYGPPGTGKTHYILENTEISDVFWFSPQPNATFFDGYEDHADLVLDDFIGSHIQRNMLLRLLDKYPYRLPVKGGTRIARYTRVFLTSNHWITDWYKDQCNLYAIQRRIHRVVVMPEMGRELLHQPVGKEEWDLLTNKYQYKFI